MRFMMIVKGTPELEQTTPTREDFECMGQYNDQLRAAGVLRTLDGLAPSRDGARINFKAGKPTVIDGPFTEAKELVAGFWIIEVKSKAEAIEWAKKIPFNNGEWVEVRRIAELDEFKDIMAPETVARENRMRAEFSGKSN